MSKLTESAAIHQLILHNDYNGTMPKHQSAYKAFHSCEMLLSDLKNQTIVSSCVTHILPSCGYFKGQEQICFNPTSWHLVTYNFL